MPTLETNRLLAVAVDACDSKKAEDVRILALDPSESSLTDYFLICSGTNERQNGAIADEIEYRLKNEFNVYANSVEGRRQGEWILLDYVDFVVHIFMPEKRAFYGLERLRKSAKSLTLNDLNDEIKAAITATRAKKSPVRKSKTSEVAPGDKPVNEEDTPQEMPRTSAKTGKKSSTKVADALTPTKKLASEKAASKLAGKESTGKTVADKSVLKKAAAKKAVKTPQQAKRA